MTDLVFPAPPVVTVPVEGGGHFPVRRIYCVGRNYWAHRVEMGRGGDDDRDPPFFFCKPTDAIVPPGGDAAYPTVTENFHHEMELVVAIGKEGANVTPQGALDLVFGYAAGVDLTRRDLQTATRKRGEPWESGKAFDQSAPISAIKPWKGPPPQGAIRLTVNGQVRQNAVVADMIWSTEEIISEASKLWRLMPGDLIYTGTPEGVGPLVRGDRVEGEVEGVGALSFKIV